MSVKKILLPSRLEAVGLALFGKQWQSDLSRALGLNDSRRMRQFMSSDRPIPLGIPSDLLALLKARKILINNEISQLEKDGASD